MDNIMYFRAGLRDVFIERNRARQAVDLRNVDDLELSLRRMKALIDGMIAEVEHQKTCGYDEGA